MCPGAGDQVQSRISRWGEELSEVQNSVPEEARSSRNETQDGVTKQTM